MKIEKPQPPQHTMQERSLMQICRLVNYEIRRYGRNHRIGTDY